MNRLNPIYLVILFLVIFILSVVSLKDVQKSIIQIQDDKKHFSKLSKEYKEYKNNWFSPKQIKKRVERIVKSISFKNEKILFTQVNNLIKVKIESKNEKILEKFLKRFLNEKFLLKRLEVKKDSIYLEIGVKV